MYDTTVVPSKDDRQQAVRRLVERSAIATQKELLRRLKRDGLVVDQSTLSRDLAELNVRKRGGRYVIEPVQANAMPTVGIESAVRSFTTCGPHLTIILTEVGQAQPVALAIEALKEPSIAGTLAGDDTIFLATRSRAAQTVALRRLVQLLGDKHVR